ncbi:MAB_1171c family putative transporter [Nocardia nova]
MSIELGLRWATGVVLIAVAAWELRRLLAHRDDLHLRILAPGLVLLAFIATLAIPADPLRPVARFFGPAWSPLVNGCWMTMACTYAMFFALAHPFASRPEPAQMRTARRDFTLLVIAVTIQTLVTTTAPPGTWHHPRQPEDYLTWRNIVFVLSVDGYSLVVWLMGAVRASRYRRHVSYLWMRAALGLVIAGAIAMALGVDGISLLTPVAGGVIGHRPEIFSMLYSIGQLGGQFALACGLSLIPIAGAVVGVLHRMDLVVRNWYARRLEPLWELLCAEFPYVRLSAADQSTAFVDVASEISDGLAELSRYAPMTTGDIRDPRTAAAAIRAGVECARQGDFAGTAPVPPYSPLEPEFTGWRQRARWMLQVSRELSHLGLEPRKGTYHDETSARASVFDPGYGADRGRLERKPGAA